MPHPIECQCKTIVGEIDEAAPFNRGRCYCRSCQAFAHFLDRAPAVLDAHGGSGIVQTSPSHVHITRGMDRMACMRLTPNGLMRWYAACCNTPIGNTLANYKLSFVGLVDACLGAQSSLDSRFGPQRMQVYTQYAIGEPKPVARGTLSSIMRLGAGIISNRLNGSYKRTPFFNENGEPIVAAKVLSSEEHAEVMNRVSGFRPRVS